MKKIEIGRINYSYPLVIRGVTLEPVASATLICVNVIY